MACHNRQCLPTDLLEAAAQAARDALELCSTPPERLKKALALGWSLATARARRAWAAVETADGAAGSAVAGIDVRDLIFLNRYVQITLKRRPRLQTAPPDQQWQALMCVI